MTGPERVVGFIGAPDAGKTATVQRVQELTQEPYLIDPPAGYRFLDFCLEVPTYIKEETDDVLDR